MSKELAEKNKHEITYQAGGQDIKLNPSIVHQFITKGDGQISKQEAVNFMQLCRYAELNPFLNEAYIVKFGNRPAQMITSKEAFMKRAERQNSYDGNDAGVIVHSDGELIERKGSLVLKSEELVGGWAIVYREDRNRPTTVKISFEEFAKYKKNGDLQATWAQMPGNMIRKSALVNALREAYPDQLGAMYTEDDKNPQEVVKEAKKVEEDETTNDLLTDFKTQHEPEEKPEFEPTDEGEELLQETENAEVTENEQESFFDGNTTNVKSE